MKIQEWIIDWFKENANINKNEISNQLFTNYLESNWIDSFKFISLITEIEEKFNIKFMNEEFQNRDFVTVHGISKIIKERINATQSKE